MGRIDWDELVDQRNVWVAHNFPNETEGVPGLASVYGVVEELGELLHCVLKEDQKIRGSAEEHQEGAKDAVGDLTIYLLGVMNRFHVRPYEDNTVDGKFPLLKVAGFVGDLADEFAAGEGEWMRVNVSGIVDYLRIYCDHRGWDYADIVLTTWAAVKMRDWVAWPNTGLPPEPDVQTVEEVKEWEMGRGK